MSDRTLVASATNLMARGFLVVPTDRRARDGGPVNGLFAAARAIERVITFKAPTRAVAVIETGPPHAPWPDLLVAQRPRLAEVMRGLGLAVVEAERELDVVASYTRAALDRGDDVIIVGVDKRYAQLVDERVWWYDANKDTRYTAEIVTKRFGVPPAQMAEWLALVGDDDALPGIDGIGAKGATGLFEQYGSIDAALAALAGIKGRLGNALRAGLDALPGERARAKLDPTRPLPAPLDDLAYRPPDTAALNALYEQLGFVELLSAQASDTHATEVAETVEAFAAARARLGAPLALHLVLAGPREDIVGIAVSAGGADACYVARASEAWPAVVAWLEDADAPKLGHDLVVAIVALRRAGVQLRGVVGDSACSSHLTEPSNWAPHDLAVTAKHVLGRALPESGATADLAGAYAQASAEIVRALSPDPALLTEHLALTGTCARMELTGIALDLEELGRAEVAFAGFEDELTSQIEALAGHSFNINSTKQLGDVLFGELKLPVASHTKTGWSTANEALEKIEHAHPIVPLVMRWRLLRRMRDSWIIALRKCVADDGRVHSRFHPARSFNGHLVNTNPDLARVPGRTPEMAMIRRAFVAPPGRVLMSVDFHQLGLYVLAHLTKDPALVEPLRRRDDLHLLTAAAVLEKPVAEITTDERQRGKVINFALFAGQGASATALQLGVPAAEAKAYIARFDAHYALVRAFQEEQYRLLRERGYLLTIAGRRWPIGGLDSLDSQLKSYADRLARRATHEGSVSDVARRALLDAERALLAAGLRAVPIHEILDEVLFEVPEAELQEAARIASAAMRGAFALEVPLVVGVEAGRNWADLEPVILDG